MKKIFLAVCVLAGTHIYAQNTFPASGSAGIGTISPHASALLEITGKKKGLLVPRMQQAQRDAIASPATGLLIYQTNGKDGFYYYSGTKWEPLVLRKGGNNSWLLSGNAGTDPLYNYIGTSGEEPLFFRVNNQKSGVIQFDVDKANTGLGYEVLLSNAGAYNTGHGFHTLYNNTAGNYNTASGNAALENNTRGFENTATGSLSLNINDTGIRNTAVGFYALKNIINTSHSNTALGAYAASDITNSSNRPSSTITAIGMRAVTLIDWLDNTSIRDGQTAAGYQALFISPYQDPYMLTNVYDGNTALGSNTLNTNYLAPEAFNTTAGSNITIPVNANSTLLGANAWGSYNYDEIRVGDEAVTSIGGQVSWTIFSDGRIKKDIKENVHGLDFIKLIKPITGHFNRATQFELTARKDTILSNTKNDIEKTAFSGFIAQDVDAAAKKAGYDFSGIDKSGQIMGLRYTDFAAPLVKALQEIIREKESIKEKHTRNMDALYKKIKNQQTQLQQINALISVTNF